MRLFAKSWGKQANRKDLTFAGLGAVVFTEGFVFGNVRIKVLQRVFGNVFSHNNLVVSKDVGERQSRQPTFIVGFYRVESHFSWKNRKGGWREVHSGSCRHSWGPFFLPTSSSRHWLSSNASPFLQCGRHRVPCDWGHPHRLWESHEPLFWDNCNNYIQTPGHMKNRTPCYTLLKTERPITKLSTTFTSINHVPFSEWSTQVKVIPPRWLSLNLNKKVPGILSFSKRRSFSLLTKPMTYLKIEQCIVLPDQTL